MSASTPSPAAPRVTLDPLMLEPLRTTRLHAELVLLSNALLLSQIQRSVSNEMATLAGELRDEWKVRVGALKADWMARWIPDERHLDVEDDDDETGEAKRGESMLPTVVSDADATEEMSKRVDAGVEKEFNERIAEAERRVRSAVQGREVLSVELMIGECLFEAQSDEQSPSETAITLHETLVDALAEQGIDAGVLIRKMRRDEKAQGVSAKDAGDMNLLTEALKTSGVRDQEVTMEDDEVVPRGDAAAGTEAQFDDAE